MAVQCIKLPGAKELGVVSSSVSRIQAETISLAKKIEELEKDIKGLERVHKRSSWQKAVRCGSR